MGFWNKLGKIALTAAPYIAAPFTGGASLMATGLANKAVQKWSESDAKKAVAKGLAPSSFDNVLGKVGGYAGLATSFIPTNALGSIGMLGNAAKAGSTAAKVGSTAANVASKASTAGKIGGTLANIGKGAIGAGGTGWQGQLGQTLGNIATSKLGGSRGPEGPAIGGGTMPQQTSVGTAVPRTMGLGPSGSRRTPDLGAALDAGKRQAIKDQPFRKGYDVHTGVGEVDEFGNYPTVRTSRMPKIGSVRSFDPAVAAQQKANKKKKKISGIAGPIVAPEEEMAEAY